MFSTFGKLTDGQTEVSSVTHSHNQLKLRGMFEPTIFLERFLLRAYHLFRAISFSLVYFKRIFCIREVCRNMDSMTMCTFF